MTIPTPAGSSADMIAWIESQVNAKYGKKDVTPATKPADGTPALEVVRAAA